MWDEITNPFLNFNGATIEVLEWISNLISYIAFQYACDNHNSYFCPRRHPHWYGYLDHMGPQETSYYTRNKKNNKKRVF